MTREPNSGEKTILGYSTELTAGDKIKLENLIARVRSGEVIGFFDPKPRGLKAIEMWEKYIVERSAL